MDAEFHLLLLMLGDDLSDGEDVVAVLIAERGVVRLRFVLAELDHAPSTMMIRMRMLLVVLMMMEELRGYKFHLNYSLILDASRY